MKPKIGPTRIDARPWPHSIRAIAFDMDGLMLNTEELYNEVIGTILERRQRQFRPETRRQMMGQPAPQAWQVLIDHERLEVGWQELQHEAEAIFEKLLPNRVMPMPGLLDLLDTIDRMKLPRCVATSSHLQFARRAIGLIGILDRFQFIVTAQDVPKGKPDPDIYLLAAKMLLVDPTELLVLEDSSNGAKSGVAAGCCVIAVPGDHSRDHSFEGVFAIAESLSDPIIVRHLG